MKIRIDGARTVTKSPVFNSCVPLLLSLYWLPVKFRISFKIVLLTYNTVHEKRIIYVHSMLAASPPSHSLRSNKGISLSFSRVKSNTGKRAFHPCASSLWNNLLLSVHSAFQLLPSKSEDTSLLLGLPPIDAGTPGTPGMPNGSSMLWSCFIDFAVEHYYF